MVQFAADWLLEGNLIAAAVEREMIRRVFRKPARLNVLEWAEKYRYLSTETSPGLPGPYRSAHAPYQREPMLVASDPRVRRLVLMWASQLGKSTVIESIIGRAIHLRPRPILVVHPKIEFAEGWSKKRLAPMIRDTPVLRELISEVKGRSSGNTLRMKQFPNGFLAVASANSASELAADAIAMLICDEIDRMTDDAGSEGDPIDLAERRLATIGDSFEILTSTPGEKDDSRIEPAYEGGDQRKFFVPCPHCDHGQILQFGAPSEPLGLKWDRDKPETAEYLCENCCALIPEKFKRRMVSQGIWVPQAPEHHYPSFHLSALYSLFPGTTWATTARKFMETKSAPKRLKTFVNTFLAETYEDKGERVDAHTLASRCVPFVDEGVEVPEGVKVLTAAVDVQDAYLEIWVWGWGVESESWTIFQQQIPGDPGTAAPWIALDEIRKRKFKDAAGKEWRIATGFVDSGGHHTQTVYEWCRPRQRERWYACKGVGGEGIAIVGKPTFQSTAKVMLYSVGTFTAKEAFLRSELHVKEPGPGYVHLADWLTIEHLKGFTSEEMKKRLVHGRRVREWFKTFDRNEPLDCRNYAAAALHALPLKWLVKHGIVRGVHAPRPTIAPMATDAAAAEASNEEAPTTADASAEAEPTPPEPPEKKRKKRRRSWVNNF